MEPVLHPGGQSEASSSVNLTIDINGNDLDTTSRDSDFSETQVTPRDHGMSSHETPGELPVASQGGQGEVNGVSHESDDEENGYSTISKVQEKRNKDDPLQAALQAFDALHEDSLIEDSVESQSPAVNGDILDGHPSPLEEWKNKIKELFQEKFQNSEQVPNTFTAKLQIIDYARNNWSLAFSKRYDVTCTRDGDILEGIVKVAVTHECVLLLGDGELVVEEVHFQDVLEVSQEM